MEKMLKECTKPHQLLHLVSGVGLGMLILALVPDLALNAFTIGITLLVVGVAGEFVVLKK